MEAAGAIVLSPKDRRRIHTNRMAALERKRTQKGHPMRLSVLYAHKRDARIEFHEATHTYTLDGALRFPISVTGVWNMFFEKMDMDATASRYFLKWADDPTSCLLYTSPSPRDRG